MQLNNILREKLILPICLIVAISATALCIIAVAINVVNLNFLFQTIGLLIVSALASWVMFLHRGTNHLEQFNYIWLSLIFFLLVQLDEFCSMVTFAHFQQKFSLALLIASFAYCFLYIGVSEIRKNINLAPTKNAIFIYANYFSFFGALAVLAGYALYLDDRTIMYILPLVMMVIAGFAAVRLLICVKTRRQFLFPFLLLLMIFIQLLSMVFNLLESQALNYAVESINEGIGMLLFGAAIFGYGGKLK